MRPYREPFSHHRLRQAYSKPSHEGHPLSGQKYDHDFGQIFHDTEVNAPRRQRSDWIGELKTPRIVKQRRPNDRGARRLFDIAIKTVARQTRSLSPVHLADVPWSAAEKVYDEITTNRLESFHAWRVFAKAYPEQFKKARRRYYLEIKQPAVPIPDYFKGMNSATLDWLTCLRISPRQISTTDLIQISKLQNLAVLDLSDGRSNDGGQANFEERIVRTWAQLATSDQAFKQLRVLLFGWQSTLSTWSFHYLESFPSLCHFVITDCQKMHQRNRREWEDDAAHYGWVARSAKKSAKSLRPLLDDHSFYLGAISGCYYNSQELFQKLTTENKSNVTDKLPILECWIGTPRPWNHIIEEFPGTRTIWFDNVKVEANPKEVNSWDAVVPEPSKRIRDADTPYKEPQSPPTKKAFARFRRTGRNAATLLQELAK